MWYVSKKELLVSKYCMSILCGSPNSITKYDA
jgi:hypothetical protein